MPTSISYTYDPIREKKFYNIPAIAFAPLGSPIPALLVGKLGKLAAAWRCHPAPPGCCVSLVLPEFPALGEN